MKTIFKYNISINDCQTIEMPKDAEILKTGVQNGKMVLWALVNPEYGKEQRWFRLIGTGHKITDEISNNMHYIGTFLLYGDSMVFHLFEMLKNNEYEL